VRERAGALLPRRARGFGGFESVAVGGLASAWGAASAAWGEEDFGGLPLTLADLRPHYDAVAELVGVCGRAGDDLSAWSHDPPAMMPPLELDSAAGALWEAYQRRRGVMLAGGLRLGESRLAACSREFRGRGPHAGLDLDFWGDHDRAVYRPRFTLDELRERPGFEHVPGVLVRTFAHGPAGVEVDAWDLRAGRAVRERGDVLVLAAGALGSARIVLRSLGALGEARPLVSNASPYFALLNLGMWGREARDRRHGLTQLTGFFRPPGAPLAGEVQVQVYSYRSHLVFKLLKDAPAAIPQSVRGARALLPMLTLASVHHPDEPGAAKTVTLRARVGEELGGEAGVPADVLDIDYATTPEECRRQREAERGVLRLLRRLGCWRIPGGTLRLAPGASIHYAGPLPMRERPGPFECDSHGRLHGHERVFIADSAAFPRLPAKSVTFTMMAHAHRVGRAAGGVRA
jgi:choline dehydrogenase-like flavoprotein